jgi:hypothetical protein
MDTNTHEWTRMRDLDFFIRGWTRMDADRRFDVRKIKIIHGLFFHAPFLEYQN